MAETHLEHPRIGVGAIIRDGQGRALMVQRDAEPDAGTWAFPGGSLEIGEPLAEGVRREAFEEAGLRVTPGDLLHVAEIRETLVDGTVKVHFVVLDYGCDLKAGDQTPHAASDARAVRWVAEPEASELQLTRGMPACLKNPRVLKFLGWLNGPTAEGGMQGPSHEG